MNSSFFQHFHSVKWVTGVALISLLFVACQNDKLIKPGDSIATAYKKALHQYEEGNYRDAVQAFETVISTARGTDYARSSYYYLAESYFKSEQYLLAADSYNRFISLYPQSERREEVAFKEALSYFNMSPRYKLSQRYTRQAIEKFRIFLSRYPDSEYADQAGVYITELRNKLAHKLYEAAQLYMRLDQYEAAIIYYDLTVNQYPESSWAERALVRKIAAYNEYASRSVPSSQRERYQKAIETYEKYLQLFPNGPNRQEAEAHVDDARAALADLGSPSGSNKATPSDQ